MQLGPVVLAIPAFFLFIAVEVLVARARRRDVYDLPDSLCNLGTGILEQTLGAVSRGLFPFTIYVLAYQHLALVHLDSASPWPWVLAFVGSDFIYYWWHRFSHEVNFMWACHAIHHQSSQFNLSVALRQNWLAGFTSAPFYVPLAIVGVEPAVFGLMKSLMILYQFWIHTRLIGRLGPLEWVLNTPSHHRVHHGIDPAYLDKNYAGTFIVWDRLFGSFTPERAAPTYGVLHPFVGSNALWAYFEPWVYLVREARGAAAIGGFWAGVRHFFAHPAARPGTGRVSEAELQAQFERARAVPAPAPLPAGRRLYIVLALGLVVLATLAFIVFAPAKNAPLLVGLSIAWIAGSLVSLSAVAGGRRAARLYEVGRHLALAALLVAWF